MSDLKLSSMDFDSMDFKDLRNAVKACYKENIMLRDEIAIMKRKYEDIIYNLDDENFSSRFVEEKNNMRTSIEQTEEAITLQAERIDENEEAYASLKVTADGISSAVKKVQDDVTTQYSNLSQTVSGLDLTIGEVKTGLETDYFTKEETETKITATAHGVVISAMAEYELKDDAQGQYSQLQTQITLNKDNIETKVGNDDFYSKFTTTAEGFVFDGNYTKFASVIYLQDMQQNGKDKMSLYYHAADDNIKYDYINMNNKLSTDAPIPIIIGNGLQAQGTSLDFDVFIGSVASGNEVATRGWVNSNIGTGGTATAVFA